MSCPDGKPREICQNLASTGTPESELDQARGIYESQHWDAVEPDYSKWLATIYPRLQACIFLRANEVDGFLMGVARVANGYPYERAFRNNAQMSVFAKLLQRLQTKTSPLSERSKMAAKNMADAWQKTRAVGVEGFEKAEALLEWGDAVQKLGEAFAREAGLNRCPTCGRWMGRASYLDGDVCENCAAGRKDARWIAQIIDGYHSMPLGDLLDWSVREQVTPEWVRALSSVHWLLDDDLELQGPRLGFLRNAYEAAQRAYNHRDIPPVLEKIVREYTGALLQSAGLGRCPRCREIIATPGSHLCAAEAVMTGEERSLENLIAAAGAEMPAVEVLSRDEWLAQAAEVWNRKARVALRTYNHDPYSSRAFAELDSRELRESQPDVTWRLERRGNGWFVVAVRPLEPAEYARPEDFVPLYRDALIRELESGASLPAEILMAYPDLLLEYGI